MEQTSDNKTILFETMPIRKAALSLIIPTVMSQLIMLFYNMADTWFIGQTGDPHQVAAVAVTYPIFMLMAALANLFGIGGGSLLSRLLGAGEREETGAVAVFSLWAAGLGIFLLSLGLLVFDGELLTLLGTDLETLPYAKDFLFWTITVGGLPTVLNMVLANLVRAQGNASVAAWGMAIGGILNVIMDPILIFSFNMGVAGAALSTCLSNVAALAFLVVYTIRQRHNSIVVIPFWPKRVGRKRIKEIFAIGTPAALQILLAAVSNAVMLRLVSNYPVAAVSGMGIMQKIETLPFQIVMGISTGILPLIAYNFAAGNRQRMDQAVRFALMLGLITAIIFLVAFEVGASQLVSFFINDAATIDYGSSFVQLRMLALPFITVEFMLIAIFQGIGHAKEAFFLSWFRKGILDLPLMMLFNLLWPLYGLMMVQPLMELSGAVIAVILYQQVKRMLKEGN